MEFRRSKEDVPPRQSRAEVATTSPSRFQRMMGTVESRRDEDMVAQPSIADAGIRVRHASHKPEAKNKKWELEGWHSDRKTHGNEPHIGDGVFKDMGSLIRPEGHLMVTVLNETAYDPQNIVLFLVSTHFFIRKARAGSQLFAGSHQFYAVNPEFPVKV
jgi:hypothetical protein